MLREKKIVRQTNNWFFNYRNHSKLAHDCFCLLTLKQRCDQEFIELERRDRRWSRASVFDSLRDVLYLDHGQHSWVHPLVLQESVMLPSIRMPINTNLDGSINCRWPRSHCLD